MVTHYEGGFIKSKLHDMSLIAIWLGWTPYTLTLGVQGAQKGGPLGFWSLRGAFWRILDKTKVAGHPQLSGGRSPYRTPNPDLEGPGAVVTHFQGELITQKL